MFGIKPKLVYIVSLLLGFACITGCGKGDYESSMNQTLTRLAFASKFQENLHPDATEAIPEVASLRLPLYITEEAKTLTMTSKNRVGDTLPKSRIQPPFLNIPGFRFSYEQHVDMGGRNNTQPVYCYLGTVPAAGRKQGAILNTIKAQVGKAFKGAVFQSVQLDDPEGNKVSVQKLSVSGKQAFETDASGGDVRQLNGQFDCYVYSSPDHHVIIGFRSSDDLAQKIGTFEKGEYALGTLAVQAIEPADGDGEDS